MKFSIRFVALLIASLVFTTAAEAQRGPGQGRGFGFRGGRGPGQGQGRGHGHDERHDADHDVFHFLLTNHEKITRKVTELAGGVETLTESEDPEIAAKIKEHVEWMKYRIDHSKPIRMRDPLFAELFQHTDKIVIKHEDTENGVRVIETSEDPYVAKLIKRHAEVVSGFVERGFAEAMKNHSVPGKTDTEKFRFANPAIMKYGSIVQLPGAAQQPRSDSKLLIDLTSGGHPNELNGGIEKVARYVNIYQGAGEKPADAAIAVVLHGDATLTALNDDAFAKRFGTEGNPNLDCLHDLHEAGVEIYVCGQSLVGEGESPEAVAVFVDVAVSALTAVVNLQEDGYSYVPLAE